MALYGCTAEKTPEPQKALPVITMSPADKEQVTAFQKEILNIENITDKAVKLAVAELKNVILGRESSLTMPALIDKAKSECLSAGETLAKKAVPETLPPEMKNLVGEGKCGLIAAYTAYAASFDAIKSFIADKNPLMLMEYRQKSSQAEKLYTEAAGKIKAVMTAAGVTQ
jgi:hypothetical protein